VAITGAWQYDTNVTNPCPKPERRCLESIAGSLHEGRHTYQLSMATAPNNDQDRDYLIDQNLPGLPVATTILDSETPRTVCNTAGPPYLFMVSYRGVADFDPFKPGDLPAPGPGGGYVGWAFEQDAYAWVNAVETALR